uniref:Uncharacterized protein n=1 Tax=Plectus sambesii TaxID=2011161 RepID=A0A914X2D5_9BILA
MQLRVGVFLVAFLGATLAAFGNDIDISGNLTDTYGELTNSSGNHINISGNYTSGNQTVVDVGESKADLDAEAKTFRIISLISAVIDMIIWIVIGIIGYKKWDWTVLAAVLVMLFGLFGLCCAMAMDTRTEKRAKAEYYPGQAQST